MNDEPLPPGASNVPPGAIPVPPSPGIPPVPDIPAQAPPVPPYQSPHTPHSAPPIPPTPHYTYPAAAPLSESSMGMFCHLLAFVGCFMPGIGNVLGPLVFWLIFREKSPSANYHGKEAINFQINISIALAASFLFFVLLGWLIIGLIGLPLMFVIGIYAIVMTIIATIKTSEGVPYRYPFVIRFIK
ncbi:MAG: hypothetical protein JWL81_1904 [Verrucomicrobiales bacterium]|nr:hypothetical protein [Verrucomicrobiales bacterium]